MVPDMPTSSATVRRYWDARIHDLEISRHEPGTPGFFADLDQYLGSQKQLGMQTQLAHPGCQRIQSRYTARAARG